MRKPSWMWAWGLGLAAACEQTPTSLGDSGPSAGPPLDAGTQDGGNSPDQGLGPDAGSADAGTVVEGLCASVAARSPIGAAAVGTRGDRELVALLPDGPAGRLTVLHEFFADLDPGVEVTLQTPRFGENDVVALAYVPDCPNVGCGRRYEVVVAGRDGTFAIRGVADWSVSVVTVLNDGRVVLRAPFAPGANRTRVVDARLGTSVDLPSEVEILGHARDPDWLVGRRLESPEGDPRQLVFVHAQTLQVRSLPQAPERGVVADGRWVFVEPLDDGSARLVTATPDGSTVRATLPGPLSNVSLQGPLWDSNAVVVLDDGMLRAILDAQSLRVIFIPRGFVDMEGRATWNAELGWFVYSVDGIPRWQVRLSDGEPQWLDPSVFAGDAFPLSDIGCISFPEPADATGRVAMVLRRPGATGLHFVGPGGLEGPLGRPLHDVDLASKARYGETWVVHGIDSSRTFCRDEVTFDEPPPADALIGPSSQIVAPDGRSIVVPTGWSGPRVDGTGRCATWHAVPPDGHSVVVDVMTEEQVELGSRIGGLTLWP